MTSDPETYKKIKGIGAEIASSLSDFFSNTQNRTVIHKLLSYGINLSTPSHDGHKQTKLTNKSICFTGALSSMTRSEAKSIAESMGAYVVASVSKNLDILVVGSDAGSKLDKAQSLGIEVLSEDQFLEIIKEK
jgi:DNA ligase (NAD+)